MTLQKTAIVTGASGNLGYAVVQKLATEGYKVIGTVEPNDPAPFELPESQFEKQVVDLSNESDSLKFITAVIVKYGKIDAAILTVGGFAMGKIADTTSTDIAHQYKLNFETAYNVARPVFVQMLQQNSGRIFLIGSKPGLSAGNSKGMIAYSLGKSLIFRLAELMNEEAMGHNVVTNVVVPGTIDTPQNRKSMPDADFSKWVKPETIASIIHHYCTDEAGALREPVIKVYGNA
ncbi:MAG: SDR family NAD(P)-dependent oxidoreductase [Chitinophagaceae bacterium]|nr:SDR family NAD(P)-dependent oxidoreductase [Chitinophagaceae bacterium]